MKERETHVFRERGEGLWGGEKDYHFVGVVLDFARLSF